jgi:hypothetical protein
MAKIVDLLLPVGFGFTVPAWDGDAYFKINNALRAVTDLTITSGGNIIWGYRFTRIPYLEPSRLIGVVLELLNPDWTMPQPTLPRYDGYPLVEILRYALSRHGLTATINETGHDTGPVLTVTNPDQPYRGTIDITDDGELQWLTRAPHHQDGGIPLPDIAATIARALTRAKHTPVHA